MFIKIFFLHLRYVIAFILRLFTLIILEIFMFYNFKNIDNDYNSINNGAINLINFKSPYENLSYKNSPIYAVLFIPNYFINYNFTKFLLIFVDLSNSILLEIFLNLQQRKFNKENRSREQINIFYFVFNKIYSILKYEKIKEKIIFEDLSNNTPRFNNSNQITNTNLTENNYLNSDHSSLNTANTYVSKETTENDSINQNIPIEKNFRFYFEKILENLMNIINNKFSIYSLYYLYNPFIIISAARGDCINIVNMFILLFMIFIELDLYSFAGIMYGISIHLEFFPIIYSPAILLYIYFKKNYFNKNDKKKIKNNRYITKFSGFFIVKIFLLIKSIYTFFMNFLFFIFGIFFSFKSLTLFSFALFTYSSLFLFFYIIFGNKFLFDYSLFHIFSVDIKLNFSAYNYLSFFIYNSYFKKLFITIIYSPQIILITLCNVLLYKDLNFLILMSTWIYFIFNKIILFRNISLIFILLCLNMPFNNIFKLKKIKYCIILSLIIYLKIYWIYLFDSLENGNNNNFLSIWITNLLIFLIDCIFIEEICSDRLNIIYPNSIVSS